MRSGCAHKLRMRAGDELAVRLAELQAGHVSARQLRSFGLTVAEIRHRVKRGRLVRVDKGVYRLAGAPPSWEGRLLAAVLRFGPDVAAVSHGAAAVLLGLDVVEHQPPIEVLVGRAHRARTSESVVVHSSDVVDRLDLTWVMRAVTIDADLARVLRPAAPVTRVRTTSAARTIVQLAARVSAHELGNLIDSAMSRGLVSDPFLRRRIAVHRGSGQPGSRLLDEVMLDAGGHSWLERRFLRLMREAGLPRPRCQVVHRAGGAHVARVDFQFDPHPLVVEVSGRVGHVSELDRRRDARRRNALQQEGYVVLEFVTADVIDSPEHVVATIRRSLAQFQAGFAITGHREP